MPTPLGEPMQAETASRVSREEPNDEVMLPQAGLALESWSRNGALYSTPGNATQALLGFHYRAIDRDGNLVDVRLSDIRDMAAAEAFFRSAWTVTGVMPDRITTDGHDAYLHAIRNVFGAQVTHRTNRSLNNYVAQDHPFVKRRVNPGLGFGAFDTAQRTIQGDEALHRLHKAKSRGSARGMSSGKTGSSTSYSGWRHNEHPLTLSSRSNQFLQFLQHHRFISHSRTASCVKLIPRCRDISAKSRKLSLYRKRHKSTRQTTSVGYCSRSKAVPVRSLNTR
jgi:DDE domain